MKKPEVSPEARAALLVLMLTAAVVSFQIDQIDEVRFAIIAGLLGVLALFVAAGLP